MTVYEHMPIDTLLFFYLSQIWKEEATLRMRCPCRPVDSFILDHTLSLRYDRKSVSMVNNPAILQPYIMTQR